MRSLSILFTSAAVLAAVTAAKAAPVITSAVFATPPAGASAPDSITLGAGSVWVSYAGDTTSDGTPPQGVSTVVRYGTNGSVQQTFKFVGSVDGLNYDKYTNTVWALQNQDGEASGQAINAATNAVTPFTYAASSTANGYDEAAFTKKGTFLSYTNPAAPGDPVLRQVVSGTNPIQVTDVATFGQTGISDPDSLKVAPNGTDLVQSGGADGKIVFIAAPGTAGQTIMTIALSQGGAGVTGLDDTAYTTARSGTLYATQTSGNQVTAFDIDNLKSGSLLASIGSLGEIALVDPLTGALTPLVTGLPGIHGLAYVADVPEPATIALFGLGLTGALALRRRG